MLVKARGGLAGGRNLPVFKCLESKHEGYLTPACAVLTSHYMLRKTHTYTNSCLCLPIRPRQLSPTKTRPVPFLLRHWMNQLCPNTLITLDNESKDAMQKESHWQRLWGMRNILQGLRDILRNIHTHGKSIGKGKQRKAVVNTGHCETSYVWCIGLTGFWALHLRRDYEDPG